MRLHFGALLRKFLAIATLLIIFVIWKSIKSMQPRTGHGVFLQDTIVFPVQNCRRINTSKHSSITSERIIFFNKTASILKKVLILSEKTSMIPKLLPILEGRRILYDIHYLSVRNRYLLPLLTEGETGKYAAIIFTSFRYYYELSTWSKHLLENYCRAFGVGMIMFNQEESPTTYVVKRAFPFKIHTRALRFKTYHISANATILRLVKGNNMLDSDKDEPEASWSVFIPRNGISFHNNVEVVATSSFVDNSLEDTIGMGRTVERYPVVVHDVGKRDNVHKIYFGAGLSFWPHKLLFLDALSFVSHHKLAKPLDRWMQVDIDDIFVGRTGIRMKEEDVKALVVIQHTLQNLVPGFQFNLGLSGKYYQRGNDDENEGDVALIKNASKFRWFGHTWAHKQPHQVDNIEDMKQQIVLNMKFAEKYNISVDTSYSVTPHHSGVYPTHDILYEVWEKTAGVKVTTTEEYPHLKPAWRRRGFVYRNIMVLPRQTCGLFTHTMFLDKYPGGKEVLLKRIYGGEIFETIVTNPISIFMTHFSNYGNDRLALYTFINVVKFIQCWTNLRLMSLPPLELGKKYFKLFPGDMDPVWQNPCTDPRHKDIWPSWKSCNRLPSFLIVGPQKTGTTALYMFLSVHPEVRQNKQNEKSFEETQFFASINYYHGLDWYMNQFPDVPSNSSTLLFEKTANYFDSAKAAMRVHALLPETKIIVVLDDPVRRAYSWYQHMRSHNNEIAWKVNFYDLLNSDANATARVKSLRNRCLIPGLFAKHLERWMLYFPSNQILTIDGVQLKSDPVHVMSQVQTFIGVKRMIDYSTLLKYDEKKGFFCLTTRAYKGRSCLGGSKGRKYPPMKRRAQEYLRDYYKEPNRRLAELLHKMRQPLPLWLRNDVLK